MTKPIAAEIVIAVNVIYTSSYLIRGVEFIREFMRSTMLEKVHKG
jgi:hypothetical protein